MLPTKRVALGGQGIVEQTGVIRRLELPSRLFPPGAGVLDTLNEQPGVHDAQS